MTFNPKCVQLADYEDTEFLRGYLNACGWRITHIDPVNNNYELPPEYYITWFAESTPFSTNDVCPVNDAEGIMGWEECGFVLIRILCPFAGCFHPTGDYSIEYYDKRPMAAHESEWPEHQSKEEFEELLRKEKNYGKGIRE